MAEDLGSRLVRAGLASREQLNEALARGPAQGGGLAARLSDLGVSEEDLVGFFLAAGLGPPVAPERLETPPREALERVRGDIARAMMAIPVELHDGALRVAMVDPSDVHAIRELRRASGVDIIPNVARLSDVRQALDRLYPAPSEPPISLVRRKDSQAHPTRAKDAPRNRAVDVSEVPVPLVRQKPFPRMVAQPDPPTSRSELGTSASNERTTSTYAPLPQDASKTPKRATSTYAALPPPETRHARDSTAREAPDEHEGRDTDVSPIPPMAEPRSIISREEAEWGDLGRSAPRAERPIRLPDVGPHLMVLRTSSARDHIVRAACEAALTVCRAAVLLALRKGVLRGWDAVGEGVSADAIHNLWIPARAPSMFRDVVAHGEAHRGAYGTTAADNLYRAATGGRGRSIVIQPIIVRRRCVAVLGVDDVRFERAGLERIEVIAHETGKALERAIVLGRP